MRKKGYLKKFLVVVVLFLIGILKVNAATNPYKQKSQFGTNCTWYAWQQVHDKVGVSLPAWGNASTWYDYAKRAGFEVGQVPRNKSIVVWDWTSNGKNYGHVGYVEKVVGDKIYVWDSASSCLDQEYPPFKECMDEAMQIDQGAQEACYSQYSKTIACEKDATYWHVPGDLIGYIYLDNVPSRPVVSTPKPQVVAPKKSNNASLSSIKISNIEFEFKKDTLEYNIVVENVIESINIEATPEHNKTKVEGTGEHPLNIGDNKISLVTTAEDGSKKTYTIQVRRKDNNAYLKNITIQNIEFEFNKEIFEYEFQVSRELERVQIDATTESELSTLEGTGNYPLMEEETTINLVVTAENENQNVYTLRLKKEAKPEPSKETKGIFKWALTIGIVFGFLVLGGIVFLIIKRKKKKRKSVL